MAMVKSSNLSLDSVSEQIISLTGIASALQKEMNLLSRRSRDNATDLLSLKEATNARDEDIRKSLRELITNAHEATTNRARDPYTGAGLMIDSKPHSHSSPVLPKSIRPFSLPRIPSPTSFAASLDRETMSTPSLYSSSDGHSSIGAHSTIAMLEKILREMGTKEGEDLLLSRLSQVAEQVSGMASAAKVDELMRFIKEREENAVIPASLAVESGGNARGMAPARDRSFSFEDAAPMDIDYSQNGPMTQRVERLLQNQGDQRRSSAPPSRANEVLNDDVIKVIKTVKDSVAQGGGLTAEVKALVRELRGEVLGMGREIGRRLDEVHNKQSSGDDDDEDSATKLEIAKVVEEGLDELKQHMNNLMRDHRRQSAATVAAATTAAAEAVPTVDYREVYNSMRAALKDNQAKQPRSHEVSREDVIEAVKYAWETYKPDIEVQHIGLERDEVLACLQEGLQQYAPHDERPRSATRDEVFTAVVDGLKHFVPPQMPSTSLSREEVLGAVRECLEEFEFPVAPSAIGAEITKEDMVDAVKRGLNGFDFPQHSSSSSSRELLALAPANLGSSSSIGGSSIHDGDETVAARLHEIMKILREEFKAVSDEAKENVAANGRDTEQVLDATRDGLEKLRADLEAYVDKVAAAVTHEDFSEGLIRTLDVFRDEMADLVSKSHSDTKDILRDDIADLVTRTHEESREILREDLADLVANTNAKSRDILRGDIADLVQKTDANSRDVLRDDIADLVTKANADSREILRSEVESLRDAVNSSLVPAVRAAPAAPAAANNREVLEALQEGVGLLRTEISNRHVAGTAEVLDAIQDGMADLRRSIERMGDKPSDLTANDEILDALKSGLGDVRSEIDTLRDESRAVATVDNNAMVPAEILRHDDIKNLEYLITQLRTKVDIIDEAQAKAAMATREIADAAPTPAPAPEPAAAPEPAPAPSVALDPEWQEKLSKMEAKLLAIHESVAGIASREAAAPPPAPAAAPAAAPATAPDPAPAQAATDAASREDVEAIETILRNTKARLDDLIDGEQSVRKDHIDAIETLVLETKLSLEAVRGQLDGVSSREDIQMVESLVSQIAKDFDEMKERHEHPDVDPEKVTKTDVDAIALACLEVKTAVENLAQANDSAEQPSKDDLLALEAVVKELKGRLETEAEVSAKAFEERQAEIIGVGEHVSEVKVFLEELNNALQMKLEDGVLGIESVGKILDSLSDTVNRNSGDLQDLFETLKSEFEESRAGVVGAKLEADEKFQQTTDTLEAKIDDRMGELLARFDDFQMAADERAKSGESRELEVEEAVNGTKEIADELKLLIDTLGSAVTDSLEKMEEASRTVFGRVDDMVVKTEDMVTKNEEWRSEGKTEHQQTRDQTAAEHQETRDQAKAEHQQTRDQTTAEHQQTRDEVKAEHQQTRDEAKAEHQQTRDEAKVEHQQTHDQLKEAVDGIQSLQGLQGDVAEFQPKILDTIKDVLAVVSEHYEHSKSSDATIQEKLIEAKVPEQPLLPPPEKYDDTTVQEKLDVLVSQTDRATDAYTKLDKMDALVDHTLAVDNALSKLDRLVEHADDTDKALVSLSKLEKLDQLDQLDHLVCQADETTQALTELEKLSKLDQIIELSSVAGRAFDSQHAKIDRLVDHSGKADEAFSKIDQLVEHTESANEAFSKIDQLVEHTESANEAFSKLDQLVEHTESANEAYGKIDQLVEHNESANEAYGKIDQLVDRTETAIDAFGKIDQLVDHTETANEAFAKLDQLERLEKLEKLEKLDHMDELVDHSRAAEKALSRLETLDTVHDQVKRTAAELSQFMAAQTQRIADEHEDREKTLQETMLALERRQAEKEHAEASIASLKEEEKHLKEGVVSLRAEQQRLWAEQETLRADQAKLRAEQEKLRAEKESLWAEQEKLLRSKAKLTADVSSLETALHLRREELYNMEARAEGLERRILEGVMDHSRVLLMAKANKGREAMNRKRVVPSKRESSSPAEAARANNLSSSNSSKPRAAFNLAMTKRNANVTGSPAGSAAGSGPNGSRRILSLSQISHNTTNGGISRSHSVRTSVGPALRKSSWTGRTTAAAAKGYGGLETDKENAPLNESEEEQGEADEGDVHTPRPEAGALVRYGDRRGPEESDDGHSDEDDIDDNDGRSDGDHSDDCHSDDDCESHSEAGTLRRSSLGRSSVGRSSLGTSVVSGATGVTGSSASGYDSEGDDEDDVMSQWTSSHTGTDSAAPSSVGGHEVVLYGEE